MTHSIDIAALLSEFGPEGRIIGFANKYYTLWTYKIVEDENNHTLHFNAFFNHNLGLNNPYRDRLPYDENLKGTELHITSGCKDVTPQVFKAERFTMMPNKGDLIENCGDADLLCWKYNKKSVDYYKTTEEQRELELVNIKNRALALGAMCFNDYLYEPKKVACDWFQKELEVRRLAELGDVIEKEMKSSIHTNGFVTIGFYDFKFADFKVVPSTYYGREYAMPVDKKGKAKRIKGKTIRINKYERVVEPEHEEFVKDYYVTGGGYIVTVPAREYFKIIDWEIVK